MLFNKNIKNFNGYNGQHTIFKPALRIAVIPLLLMLLPVGVQSSDNPLLIGTYPIPVFTISTTEGEYIELYQKIANRYNWNTKLVMQPTKRIQHNFKKGKFLGYFPELIEHLPEDSCKSEPIGRKRVHAFTLRDKKIINQSSDLEGLKIGAVAGYSYGSEITQNPKINIAYHPNDIANIKMLLTQHIDVILGDDITTVDAIKQLQVSNTIHYDVDSPIKILDIFFVFKNTPTGLKLCQEASTFIRENNLH